jgi:hypothetical protein
VLTIASKTAQKKRMRPKRTLSSCEPAGSEASAWASVCSLSELS